MLPGRTFTLDEIGRIIRRRWLLILLPLAFGAAAGGLAFRKSPVRYQSETVILVVPQRIPESSVKATDELNVQERLRSLSEQIQARANLTKIIKDFGLYEQTRGDDISEQVLQRMRADIDVNFAAHELTFRLAYIHPDPRVAQKVTERLAALYIDENVRDPASVSEGTSLFLDSELQKARQRRQIAEQGIVLDPASQPARPHNQRARIAILFAGPGGGLVAGLLLVAFLERRNSSFRREEDLMRVLSLPVLALIPVMDDDAHAETRPGGGAPSRITAVFAWVGSAGAALLGNTQS